MISASNDLKNVLYNNASIKMGTGCTIEYNMNSMLDNITASYSSSLEPLYVTSSGGKVNTYKKLFPIDSIIKPFRPLSPGVKYLIYTAQTASGEAFPTSTPKQHTDTPSNTFYAPQTVVYPGTGVAGYESANTPVYPRLYYPGDTTAYKYWVTPINQNLDVTVVYSVISASIKEASSSGTVVTYKTYSSHGFTSGQTVSITGLSTSTFNLSSVIIDSILSETIFTVKNSATGTWALSQSGVATLSAVTKPAASNKIVAQFEKTHALPTNYTFTITYSDNTTASVGPTATNASGRVIIYWNGTSWVTTEPQTYSDPKNIKSIKLQATNPGGGKVLGLIELSARWIKDISLDILNMDIQKESSASSEDILPVGKITANSLDLSLIKYNQSVIQYIAYNRSDTIFDITKNYIVKNAELKPFFSIYHENGAFGTTGQKYDKVQQGSYYIDSWQIEEFGEVSLNALDGAKYLMETIVPDILCEGYPATGVIRRLLDSVGFTNYEIRTAAEDKSIPLINYWWSREDRTVWDSLQELCRDIQMNAFFDENNILQFYSRDYLYSKLTFDWEFYFEKEGSKLANISSFSKQEIPGANQVKILWSSPITSNYVGTSTELWTQEQSYLTSGGLKNAISASTSPEQTDLTVLIETLDSYSPTAILYSYSGYVLIDSEVIEYDAIQYQYVPISGSGLQLIWIESESDISKYRKLSLPGYADPRKPSESAYFKPTGKYRVKKRGAFGTTPASHTSSDIQSLTSWNQTKAVWK